MEAKHRVVIGVGSVALLDLGDSGGVSRPEPLGGCADGLKRALGSTKPSWFSAKEGMTAGIIRRIVAFAKEAQDA